MSDKKCIKCETILTKCVAVEACGRFIVHKVKDPIKNSKVNNIVGLCLYVCSNCGYVEWYVDNPENYK